jgi:hypothetical protein
MNEGIQFNTTSFVEQLSNLMGWVDGQMDGGVKRGVSLDGTPEGNGCYSYTQLLLFSSGSHFLFFFPKRWLVTTATTSTQSLNTFTALSYNW